MNSITLCCTTNKPNPILLQKMVDSAKEFDEIYIHINDNKPLNSYINILTKNINQIFLPNKVSASEGFNKAIEYAESEWICPFCDDDFFHVQNLHELLTWFKNTNIQEDIVQFPCYVGNEVTNEWMMWGINKANFEGLQQRDMLPFSCFYRKSLWKKVLGYDDLPFNDWGFWLKVFRLNPTVKFWDKPIYFFRQGVEERLSDKDRKKQDFNCVRKMLVDRALTYDKA